MAFSFGGLISAVVGAVAKVANAVVNALSPVAKSGGIVGGIAGAAVGVAEAVLGATAEFADVCEDGEIDEGEEELLEEAFKLLVGAFIFPFDSGSSECNSAEEKSTIFNSVGAAVEKSWNSIKEIGHDFWSGMDNRGQKAFDSGYDFANWLGCGVPDVVKETLKSNAERSEKAFDSAYDFSNWISSGSVDMVKETFNPKDPLSKEHWLNSFGTASAIFGIKETKGSVPKKSGVGVKEDSKSIDNVYDATKGVSKADNIPGRGYHKEVYANKPVKVTEAVDKWDEFLGPGEYTDIHPRTGLKDSDRIFSADGKRSIRFGSHEMNSKPTKFHYHEETWTYDPIDNVMNVDNTVVRVPYKK